jgi:hypothetical protein
MLAGVSPKVWNGEEEGKRRMKKKKRKDGEVEGEEE